MTPQQRIAMELALEAFEVVYVNQPSNHFAKAITALKEALAQPEQEPVAITTGVYGGRFTYVTNKPHVILPDGMGLYASPQRKPLTDEQIMAIGRELGLKCKLGGNLNIDFDYARAIEAAHGIKE